MNLGFKLWLLSTSGCVGEIQSCATTKDTGLTSSPYSTFNGDPLFFAGEVYEGLSSSASQTPEYVAIWASMVRKSYREGETPPVSEATSTPWTLHPVLPNMGNVGHG